MTMFWRQSGLPNQRYRCSVQVCTPVHLDRMHRRDHRVDCGTWTTHLHRGSATDPSQRLTVHPSVPLRSHMHPVTSDLCRVCASTSPQCHPAVVTVSLAGSDHPQCLRTPCSANLMVSVDGVRCPTSLAVGSVHPQLRC